MDKCADTPAGVQVDGSGCLLDSDGDGVYDDKDQCTGTPLGAVVDSTGCPLDSDKDGDEENKLNEKSKVDDQYVSRLVYTIQTGSFLEIERAQKQFDSVVQVLNAKEIDYLRIEKVGNYYTVRLGKFLDYASVEGFLQDIKLQISEAVILKAHIKNERLIRLYE